MAPVIRKNGYQSAENYGATDSTWFFNLIEFNISIFTDSKFIV